jgi:undecaprenyl-diphosphatase
VDTSLAHSLNSFLVRHDGVEDPLSAYMSAAELLFLGMLVAAFAFAMGRRREGVRRAAAAAGLSAGAALALAQVLSRVVDRPRPFVAHPDQVHLFVAHAADPGFPSDHTTAAFAIGVALLLRFRTWGIAALVAATVLAVGRVGIGVHYPTDVLGGALLGALTAALLHLPVLRRPQHDLADAVGRLLDGAARGVSTRVGALNRP